MFEHKKLTKLDSFFAPLSARPERGVYFYRINSYSPAVSDFIRKYYECARQSGVVLEGGIPNPDAKHIEYYTEMMGGSFQMSPAFVSSSLSKWLPRMSPSQREAVSSAIYGTLDQLRQSGKNEGMLKNCYIKFMCWLYYKFERITSRLGNDEVPKILYEGTITNYELLLCAVLSRAGCDVVLLQYEGDAPYMKLDAGSQYSDAYAAVGLSAFPPGFTLKKVRSDLQELFDRQRLYGTPPEISACTNAWCTGNGLEDLRTSFGLRGKDTNLFYNCFYRISGVEDKQTYPATLFQLRQELVSQGRNVLVLDKPLQQPTPEETAEFPHKQYNKASDMVADLSAKIISMDVLLRRLVVKSFVDVMMDRAKEEPSVQKLTNEALHLLCWLHRYRSALWKNWQMPATACLLLLGGCHNPMEALFLKLLVKLPVDIVILVPNLDKRCCLEDDLLLEQHYETSLALEAYPLESSDLRVGTTAYHAERELDTLMYQDSGIYRSQQYAKANAVTLQTMYEEIFILWNQEARFRPNFNTTDDTVGIPVLFAKISGVKDGNASAYWQSVEKLTEGDPFIIVKAPMINPLAANPLRNQTAQFINGTTLLRDAIRRHSGYKYGLLREETQNHILDKLELMINKQLIAGNPEELKYQILSTVLNLPTDLVRRIQRMDFTKVPEKLLYVNVGERPVSVEDAIVAAFLNLIGFDVLFLVPTGYRSVEAHYTKPLIQEHQIGEYLYDMKVPNLYRSAEKAKKSAAKAKNGGLKIFKKRGNS